MCSVIVFGGTAEGRRLAEYLAARNIPSIIHVATEYGEELLSCAEPVTVRVGRLDETGILALLRSEEPRLVVDATHPYATIVSENIRSACNLNDTCYIRVLRESIEAGGCRSFSSMETLVEWLSGTSGVIFATTGAKEAELLTAVPDFAERIYLRILPYPKGIEACIELGYPMKHLICMQGPFSRELNVALFRETDTSILVTKESGMNGGFEEKVSAAEECGIQVAVVSRPILETGYSLEEVKTLLAGGLTR